MTAVRAYLELARVSNLPTCFTNVLVGVAIGARVSGESPAAPVVVILCIAVALLYTGGMILNDAVDAPFDRVHNPGRPIPSGRVCRRRASVYGALAIALGVGGVGGAALAAGTGLAAPAWAGALAASIVVYDLVHKRLAAAPILMGVCRGLVYVTSAAAVGGRIEPAVAFTIAGAMTVYVTVVTVLARGEHGSDSPRWRTPLALLLPALVVAPALVLRPAGPAWPAWPAWSALAACVVAGVAAAAWALRGAMLLARGPDRARDAVMTWLAGICLADAFSLTLLDRPILACAAVGLFFLTILGHRRIVGT